MTERPLRGVAVLVTRPATQAAELVQAIEAAGGSAILFPVIRIEVRPAEAIRDEMQRLPNPDIVIFISRNAVQHGLAYHAPGAARIAAIGPSTRNAIEQAGYAVDIAAVDGFDSEQLLATAELQEVAGKSVRIVRGSAGRDLLATELALRGARVDYLSVYERLAVTHSAAEMLHLRDLWQAGGIHRVTIMSVESFNNLWSILPVEGRQLLQCTPLVTPSRRVIQAVNDKIPGSPATLAAGPQAADMLRALIAATAPGTRHEA
ncbi:MAG: uroporphyrinogen-III synthase [Woeseia sp.]